MFLKFLMEYFRSNIYMLMKMTIKKLMIETGSRHMRFQENKKLNIIMKNRVYLEV